MLDYEKLTLMGQEHGFTHVSPLDVSTIQLMQEVRDMCQNNRCGRYASNWACPPGCGTLEECEKIIRRYRHGILVQTVGELEDSMDFEAMVDTEARHKEAFRSLHHDLLPLYPHMKAVGAGTCTLCKECTYPDAPCRFPEKSVSSMEAYGMLVTQVCKDNHMKYYYGPNTVSYTSCFLLE